MLQLLDLDERKEIHVWVMVEKPKLNIMENRSMKSFSKGKIIKVQRTLLKIYMAIILILYCFHLIYILIKTTFTFVHFELLHYIFKPSDKLCPVEI